MNAPVVVIAGGEPLMHPEIDVIAKGMIERKKFVYLCTNAILLEKNLDRFAPSPYLTFNVHLDGLRETHDKCVDREGTFDKAVSAIKAAKARLPRQHQHDGLRRRRPARVSRDVRHGDGSGRGWDDDLAGLQLRLAPDQDHFLKREQTKKLFKEILGPLRTPRGKRWQFNQSVFFLKFLMGEVDYECTPWGNPNYNVFGWQKPCYLLNDGYAKSFKELIETTEWEKYGHKSGNLRCRDCMVHCGYEPTAVIDATSSLKNMLISIRGLS